MLFNEAVRRKGRRCDVRCRCSAVRARRLCQFGLAVSRVQRFITTKLAEEVFDGRGLQLDGSECRRRRFRVRAFKGVVRPSLPGLGGSSRRGDSFINGSLRCIDGSLRCIDGSLRCIDGRQSLGSIECRDFIERHVGGMPRRLLSRVLNESLCESGLPVESHGALFVARLRCGLFRETRLRFHGLVVGIVWHGSRAGIGVNLGWQFRAVRGVNRDRFCRR